MKRRNTRRAESRRQDRYDEMPQRRHREELYEDDFGYDDEDIDDASFRRNVNYGQQDYQRQGGRRQMEDGSGYGHQGYYPQGYQGYQQPWQHSGFRDEGFGYRGAYGQQGYQGQGGRWNMEGGSGYGQQGYYPQGYQGGRNYGQQQFDNQRYGQSRYEEQMGQYYNGPQRYAGAGSGYNEIQGHGNRWENQTSGQWNPQQGGRWNMEGGSGYGHQGFREQGLGYGGNYGQQNYGPQGYGQQGYVQQGYGQPNREHSDQFWGAGEKREEDSERQRSQDPYRSQQSTSLSAQGASMSGSRETTSGEEKNQWKQHTSTGTEQRVDQRREEETPNMGLRTPSPTDENKNKKK